MILFKRKGKNKRLPIDNYYAAMYEIEKNREKFHVERLNREEQHKRFMFELEQCSRLGSKVWDFMKDYYESLSPIELQCLLWDQRDNYGTCIPIALKPHLNEWGVLPFYFPMKYAGIVYVTSH